MCLQKSSAEFRQDTHQIDYQPPDMVGNHRFSVIHTGSTSKTLHSLAVTATHKQTANSRGQTAANISKAGHSVWSLQTSFRTSGISTICGRWSWMLEYASISVTSASLPLGLFVWPWKSDYCPISAVIRLFRWSCKHHDVICFITQ